MALRSANAGKASRVWVLTTALLVVVLSFPTLASGTADLPGFSILGRTGSFRLSGNTEGLYPGAAVVVWVKVANPKGFPIRVRRVNISVGVDPSRPACRPVDYIRTTPYRGSLKIPAKSSRRLMIPLSMLPSAPDACQGASFTMRYTGKAERA